MSKNTYIAIIVVVLIVVIGGWYWYANMNRANAPAPSESQTPAGEAQTSTPLNSNQTSTPAGASLNQPAVIAYTDSGYSPDTLTVKIGTSVTWQNQSSGNMWTASNVHPTHTLYDGTSLRQHCANPTPNSFDECHADSPGSSWSFTFNKVGTWKYHNHVDPGMTGTVLVTQ